MEVHDLHGKASSPTRLGAAVQIDVIENYQMVDGARTKKTKTKALEFFLTLAAVYRPLPLKRSRAERFSR